VLFYEFLVLTTRFTRRIKSCYIDSCGTQSVYPHSVYPHSVYPHAYAFRSLLSSTNVTGPWLTRDTSIAAPKTPSRTQSLPLGIMVFTC